MDLFLFSGFDFYARFVWGYKICCCKICHRYRGKCYVWATKEIYAQYCRMCGKQNIFVQKKKTWDIIEMRMRRNWNDWNKIWGRLMFNFSNSMWVLVGIARHFIRPRHVAVRTPLQTSDDQPCQTKHSLPLPEWWKCTEEEINFFHSVLFVSPLLPVSSWKSL